MEKCHCARVSFQEIVTKAEELKINFEEAARQFGAGITCTACCEYFRKYCEENKLTKAA